MKVAILILLYFLKSKATALSFKKIEGLDELVQVVNFDSDGNIFAGLDNNIDRHELYKISSTKEILWKIDIPENFGTLWDLRVTSKNQLYLDFRNSNEGLYPLAILQPNSTEILQVEDDFTDFLFIVDGNDDLLYLKKLGVYLLKPNSTTPIPVKNLEDGFVFSPELADIDKVGNVYLGLTSRKVAVISNEAQLEEEPIARLIEDPDPTGFVIEDIAIDENDNLWTVCTDGFATNFKKLNNDALEIVATDDYGMHRLLPTKDKIFVYGHYSTTDNRNATIYYLTLNGEMIRIPELEIIDFGTYLENNGIADSEGNAYFHASKGVLSQSLGPLVVVDPDGKVTPTDLDVSSSNIDIVKLDANEDVWIKTASTSGLKQDLYRLKKGETVPENVNFDVSSACISYMGDLYVNFVTKEVYVSCTDGLYVVTED